MDDIIISFVIPVFNQAEHVDEWIRKFEVYQHNNVEVVIVDDGSTDQLKEVVEKYSDNRIKIVKHKERLGQDRNILYGIKESIGRFIWLFRTKDYVVASQIDEVIDVINNNDNIAYITASCVDEDGNPAITYEEDKYIPKGFEALEAHGHLYLHPSGSLYRRKWIDTNKLDTFLKEKTDAKHFIYLCSIMRLSLSKKGGFVLLKDVNWVYTHTVRAKTKSANVAEKNGKYIFDPDYNYMRCSAEYAWANDELTGKERSYAFARIFGWYLITVTWEYYLDTKNIDHVCHYGIGLRHVDMDKERELYLTEIDKLEKKYSVVNDDYYQKLKNNYLKLNVDYCNQIVEE